jgi:hypothetical protein
MDSVAFFGFTWRQVLIGGILSLTLFAGSIALLAAFVVRMPVDCLTPGYHPPPQKIVSRIWKNLAGILLILLGIAMSLPGIPGQGLLTVLMGVMISDFPGKRRMERWIASRNGVLPALNKLRARYGKPPLQL